MAHPNFFSFHKMSTFTPPFSQSLCQFSVNKDPCVDKEAKRLLKIWHDWMGNAQVDIHS